MMKQIIIQFWKIYFWTIAVVYLIEILFVFNAISQSAHAEKQLVGVTILIIGVIFTVGALTALYGYAYQVVFGNRKIWRLNFTGLMLVLAYNFISTFKYIETSGQLTAVYAVKIIALQLLFVPLYFSLFRYAQKAPLK